MRFAFLFTLAFAAQGELLDRVAVTIGNQVITQSEITTEIRMTAFLNNEPPQFTAKAKREAAGRLIEQKLVGREMELGRYGEGVEPEAGAMLDKLEQTRSHGKGEFDAALKAAGITKKQLLDHLLWGLKLSSFIDLRFRPAVQVSREEIEEYYNQKLLPDPATGKKLNLAAVRQQIRQTLSADRADQQMDAWVKDAESRAHIEFHKEAFEDGE